MRTPASDPTHPAKGRRAGPQSVGRIFSILDSIASSRAGATLSQLAVIGALAPDADLAIYLDKVESSNPIRYAVTVGERRDLYCTAMGKALLAHFEPARLKKYLKSCPRERFTTTTITSTADLLAELSHIRREGIARTNGERVRGANGLAAPLFGSAGTVVAALLIAGPSERMRANAKSNERFLKNAAAECTRLAGGNAR